MSVLWHDLRSGARMIVRSPGFSILAIATLALGIGANTALFSVVNAVLLRPLPYRDPGRLVLLWSTFEKQGVARSGSSLPDYRVWRDEASSLDGLGGFYYSDFNLSGEGHAAERVQGACVTPELLAVLGVEPALGRSFLPEESTFGRDDVVVLSHGLWKRRYDADPAIVGRTIPVSGRSYLVVGVLPEGIPFLDDLPPVEILAPLSFPPGNVMDSRTNHFVSLVGRLREGASVESAQAEVSTIARRLEQEFTENTGLGAKLVPLQEAIVEGSRAQLLVLLGAVLSVLLVACANVANLLLARAASREREIAIRASLGAGGARLLHQMLLEGVPLALLGGLGGLFLAVWGTEGLVKLLPVALPRHNPIGFDGRVFSFAAAISLLTVVVFGLVPALHASRADVRTGLGEGGRGSTAGRRRHRLLGILVSTEIALSLVLLASAGVMLRSFSRLRLADPGFDAGSALTLSIPLGSAHSGPIPGRRFLDALIERLRALPDVHAAGVATVLPLGYGFGWGKYFSVEGRPVPSRVDQVPLVQFALVSEDYFRAAGIALRRGRAFTSSDAPEAHQVAIVNEALVRRFFPSEEPLEKTIYMGTPESLQAPGGDLERYVRRTIVGVVADVKDRGLAEPSRPMVFVPYRQNDGEGWSDTLAFVVRSSSSPPLTLLPSVTALLRELDPEQPVTRIATLQDLVDEALSRSRFATLLLGLFAALALLLAAVGIYGVTAYSVTERTAEFGIRVALGARSREIARLVLRRGLALALVGVGSGLAAAFLLTRLLASQLYEVSATDPLTFVVVAVLLTSVAAVACLLPARRAARVDPAVTLRAQ